jgi:Protein of unknown function with PCYCGC motif
MRRFFSLIALLVLLLPPILATSCAAAPQTQAMKMAPVSSLPPEMQNAPTQVREAYQFAVANPDLMKEIPCYCGCGALGHTSNYSCYVKDVSDGKVVFDQHALGCSLCVDITQDALRLSKEGKSPGDIHSFIVANYSRFGPPNQ